MPWTSSSAVARRCQSEGLNKGTTPCLAMAQSPTGGWPFSLHDTYIYIYIDIDILYIYIIIYVYIYISLHIYISLYLYLYTVSYSIYIYINISPHVFQQIPNGCRSNFYICQCLYFLNSPNPGFWQFWLWILAASWVAPGAKLRPDIPRRFAAHQLPGSKNLDLDPGLCHWMSRTQQNIPRIKRRTRLMHFWSVCGFVTPVSSATKAAPAPVFWSPEVIWIITRLGLDPPWILILETRPRSTHHPPVIPSRGKGRWHNFSLATARARHGEGLVLAS